MEDYKDMSDDQLRIEFSQNKQQLFYQAFRNHGLEQNQYMDEKNCWIFQSADDTVDLHQYFFYQAIQQIHKRKNEYEIESRPTEKEHKLTVGEYVEKVISVLATFHISILRQQQYCEEMKTKVQEFNRTYEKLITGQIPIKTTENKIQISYILEPDNMEILKHYRIKFKAQTNQPTYDSINAYNQQKNVCLLDITDQVMSIDFQIWGLKRENPIVEGQFNEIATVNLPLADVFINTRAINFEREEMQPVFLYIKYKDRSLDTPFQRPVENQFAFQPQLNVSGRLHMIQMAVSDVQIEIAELEKEIYKKDDTLQQILVPFNSFIIYKKFKGISSPKKDSNTCYTKCSIF